MKNRIDFDALKEQDYYLMQGLAFISVIVGLIHKNYKNKSKQLKMNVGELHSKLRFIKIVKNGNSWQLANYNKKTLELLKSFGFIGNIETEI